MMQIFRTKAETRSALAEWRRGGAVIALVPTMGYLHAGHLALVARARAEAGPSGKVVVTIFVNPTQFAPGEDLATYPRDEARDFALLREAGADGVFAPEVAEVYDAEAETIVETTQLSRVLIGRIRPGHFRGVTTVVSKLFNIIQPDLACFGEKDFQQLTVIRRMVKDLDIPVRIIGVPTVREADGLAMSSRNVRLAPEDRAAAPVIFRALQSGEALAAEGVTASKIRAHVAGKIEAEPRAELQSVDIRDAASLASLTGPLTAPAVLLVAVRFGKVLLIDQHVIQPAA